MTKKTELDKFIERVNWLYDNPPPPKPEPFNGVVGTNFMLKPNWYMYNFTFPITYNTNPLIITSVF